MSPKRKTTDTVAYVTASRLAEILGVHIQHVLKLTREGKLPCKRVGRAIRYRLDEVDAAVTLMATNP